MKVFISWSGPRSHHVAQALYNWIPKVLQAVKPWMSSEDIANGSRWSDKIAQELESNHIGIICLTPENKEKPWVMFEAGALSKTLGMAYVCPYLIGLDPAEINPPLNVFQSSRSDKKSNLGLLKTLNERLLATNLNGVTDQHLEESFEKWWSDLDKQLNEIPEVDTPEIPKRPMDEILEEILINTREQLRRENERTNTIRKVENQRALFEMYSGTNITNPLIEQIKQRRNENVHRSAEPSVVSLESSSKQISDPNDHNQEVSDFDDRNRSLNNLDLTNQAKESKDED